MAFIYDTVNTTQNTLDDPEELGVVTSTGAIVVTSICVLMPGEDARLINDGLIASGNIAVSATNDVRIVNTGSITGELQAIGIGINNTTITTSTITNSGEIISYAGSGIVCGEAGIRLTNTGLISGTSRGINFTGTEVIATNLINNAGTIALTGGGGFAVSCGGTTLLTNTGQILGDVALGTGNDTLDNRLGEITGNITLGNGDNLFRGGVTEEVVLGGGGLDTLRGAAGDDSLTGSSGNDLLVGGDGDDVLIGGLNDDTLRGGNGDDTLIGGGTVDVMSGGRGIDVFVFETIGDSDTLQAPDLIEGFSKKEDVIDLSALTATPLVFAGNAPLAGGGAASVAYARAGGVLIVSVDTTGDAVAEMVFHITGTASLTATNFLL